MRPVKNKVLSCYVTFYVWMIRELVFMNLVVCRATCTECDACAANSFACATLLSRELAIGVISVVLVQHIK